MDLAAYGLGDGDGDDSMDEGKDYGSPLGSPRRPYAFCTDDNLDQCTTYINQELSTLGFMPVASGRERQSPLKHNVRLVNCVYDLLQQHRHNISVVQQKDNRIQRLDSEIKMNRTTQFHLKEQLEATEREAASCAEKERQCNVINKSLNSQIKALKDELRRVRSDHQHQLNQLNHKNRRIEGELAKLKEKRLAATQRASAGGQLSQLSVLNDKEKGDRKRACWNKPSGSHEVDVYEKVIARHQSREDELVSQNTELREMLTGFQQEVSTVLHHTRIPSSSVKAEDSDLSSSSSNSLSATQNPSVVPALPHAGFLQAMEESLLNRWQLLKRELSVVSSPRPQPAMSTASGSGRSLDTTSAITPRSVEMEALRKRMASYEILLSEKEKELQTQIDLRLESEVRKPHILSVTKVAAARDRLDADRVLIAEQRRQLDEDRALLVHTAQEMDRQRDEIASQSGQPLQSALRDAHDFLDSSIFGQAQSASPPLRTPPASNTPERCTTPTETNGRSPSSRPTTPQTKSKHSSMTPGPSLKAARAYRSVRRTPHEKQYVHSGLTGSPAMVSSPVSRTPRRPQPPAPLAMPPTSTPHNHNFLEAFHNGTRTASPTLPKSRLGVGERSSTPTFRQAVDASQLSWSPSHQLASFVDQSF